MHSASFYFISAIVWMVGIPGQLVLPAVAEEVVAVGPYTDVECVDCHTKRDPELIRQLSEGPHNTDSGVVCSSCHGDRHQQVNIRARKNGSCTSCHGGPASHSYATSKHGVIYQLNEDKQDWQQPLQRGNYRAPSCSYCHLHNTDHGDSMADSPNEQQRQGICSGCHSPRYIRELMASGKRLLEIADLKVTEGENLMTTAIETQSISLSTLRSNLRKHRTNVLLGIGHQSPDYQWWHGQPALDGDLIRIRDAIESLHTGKPLVMDGVNTTPH